jgi:hypothetical protein
LIGCRGINKSNPQRLVKQEIKQKIENLFLDTIEYEIKIIKQEYISRHQFDLNQIAEIEESILLNSELLD